MTPVRKAVIPAAGLGTRVLPASKSVPKEMLPIVDKPAIQYIVEEAVRSGITDILIITSRGKTVLEDHFDRSPELEQRLRDGDKQQLLQSVREIGSMANIHYIRQKEMLGLGHAVYQARSFVGQEPFAVLYGDDVIMGQDPVCGQLCRAYQTHGLGVVGIKEVAPHLVAQYCSMKLAPLAGNQYAISDMIEKPKPGQQFSNFSILGRCVLPPSIFALLETIPKGAGGEYQLTDAMRLLAQNQGMIGVDFDGIRYDMGSKLGYMQANVETALQHAEIGADFRQYLKQLAKEL